MGGEERNHAPILASSALQLYHLFAFEVRVGSFLIEYMRGKLVICSALVIAFFTTRFTRNSKKH
eukprot:1195135-Prorocentrum_minimum.AAC.2